VRPGVPCRCSQLLKPHARHPAPPRPCLFPLQPLSELTPSDSERLITVSGGRDKVLRAVALILNTVSETVACCRWCWWWWCASLGVEGRAWQAHWAGLLRADARTHAAGTCVRTRSMHALTCPNALSRTPAPLCLLQLSADDKFSSYMDLTLQLANTQVRAQHKPHRLPPPPHTLRMLCLVQQQLTPSPCSCCSDYAHVCMYAPACLPDCSCCRA
jgi:hypothetical protein